MRRESALFAAQVLFLWMFFAADPLEQLAERGRFEPSSPATREEAYRLAADWRHGMAGNSPLYLPGFLALALAVWFRDRHPPFTIARAVPVLLAAVLAARLAAPMGAAPLVDRFEREAGVQATAAVEAATLRTTGVAVYTLITWSVFIAGSRRAFVRRSPRPLAPVLPMTAILAAIRPWTVGDFSTLWITGVATGNIVAIGSLAAWVLVFSWLIVSDLRAVRRQRSIDTGPHAA